MDTDLLISVIAACVALTVMAPIVWRVALMLRYQPKRRARQRRTRSGDFEADRSATPFRRLDPGRRPSFDADFPHALYEDDEF